MLARLSTAARFALGAMFVYAALTKITAPWLTFAMAIDSYQILPETMVYVVARLLPWFELAIGLLLVSGIGVRWSSLAGTLLLGFFLAIMAISLKKGLGGIDCGCFGSGDKLGPMTLVRDSSFVALALFVTVTSFWPARRAVH